MNPLVSSVGKSTRAFQPVMRFSLVRRLRSPPQTIEMFGWLSSIVSKKFTLNRIPGMLFSGWGGGGGGDKDQIIVCNSHLAVTQSGK